MKCQVLLVALFAYAARAIELASSSATDLSASQQLQQQREVAYLITEAEHGHPIKDVIQLLKDTAEKAGEEAKQEQKLFDKYVYGTERLIKKLTENIAKEAKKKESYEDKLKAKTAKYTLLLEELKTGEDELGKLQAAGEAAAADRAEDVALEKSNEEDSNSTLAALKEAKTSLEDAAAQGKSTTLLQQAVGALMLKPLIIEKIPQDKQNMFLGLAAEKGFASPLDGEVPEKTKYNVKSDKVIDLIKQLINDFEDDALKAKTDAVKAKNEYELAKRARDEAIRIAQEAVSTKEELIAEVNGTINQLSEDLDGAEGTLAAESQSLKDRQTSLKTKKGEMKERSYQRDREQKAIEYGIKILQKVTGVRTASSLLQFKAAKSTQRIVGDRKKAEVVQYFRTKAQRIKSHGLKVLADEIEEHMDLPSVSQEIDIMLQNQINKMNAAQATDDDKQIECNTKINKTATEKELKETNMQELDDKLKSMGGTLGGLTDDILAAKDSIAELKAQMHQDKMQRQDSKNENMITIRDAQAAQDALTTATKTIHDFFKDAKAEAAAFIQGKFILKKREEPDAGFDGGYTGISSGGKVIEMLEQTSADFATLQADVEAQETAAVEDFDKLMTDSKKELATKEAELEVKTAEKNRFLEKIEGAKTQYKLSDRQAAALEKYLSEVAIDCNVTIYEQRKKDRTEEVVAFKESREKLAEAFNTTDAASDATSALTVGDVAQATPAVVSSPVVSDPRPQATSFLSPVRARSS